MDSQNLRVDRLVNQNNSLIRWRPIPLDHLLGQLKISDIKLQIVLWIWIFLIALSITSVLVLSPTQSLMNADGQQSLYSFFMMYPPLFLGTLLLFWLGFEWGFIPVFLSAFLIAFASNMPYYWAILFGTAFVLGLAIYGLAYYSVPVSTRLNSLKSLAYYTVVSFLAAIASSLGAFVWTLYHDISAAESIIIWKGWWTGVFLQSMILVGPFIYFFTPPIERLKRRYFKIPSPQVSLNWIYASIGSVVVVLTLFIIGAQMLGSTGLQQELELLPSYLGEDLLKVNESFQIISRISIALVLAAGLGGIYLVGSWNKTLKEQVDQKTELLQKSETRLRDALNERDSLLKQIHDRVRSNLTIMLALLELQLKNEVDKPMDKILKDSHSRIRSMAIIHETMHQSDQVDQVNLKSYAIKLSNRLGQSYDQRDQNIDVSIMADEVYLDIDRAVPFAMILNELLVNAYMHAFEGMQEGTILVEIREHNETIFLAVRDNGVGLPDDFNQKERKSLGMKVIRTLSRQLHGEFCIENTRKTSFKLQIPVEVPPARVNLN